MNRLILIFIILLASLEVKASEKYVVVFWNLENFFDHIDQGITESDKEFSSFGSRRWTKKKFQAKHILALLAYTALTIVVTMMVIAK